MFSPQPFSDQKLHQLLQAMRGHRLWEERLKMAGESYLSAFLLHVCRTVPYYSSLFQSGRKPDLIPGMSDFPLLTKSDILAISDELCSGAFDKDSLIVSATSGTTGMPLKVVRDLASWYRFGFEAYASAANCIPSFRSSLRRGTLGVVLLNDNPIRTPWTMINPSINYTLIDKMVLGKNEESDFSIIERLRGERIPLLTGRPRTLLRLAELDENVPPNGTHIAPNAILCSGDNLHNDDRTHLEAWFCCKVHNAYASTEGGFMGVECIYQTGVHVFADRARLEIFKEDGTIDGDGTGELVVTNLENWAMPFVRYRTGDSATIEIVSCACGYHGINIVELSGRESRFFTVRGRRIPPTYLNTIFEELPVRQFQVTQESSSAFRIKWIPRSRSINIEEIQQAITEAFHERLGVVDLAISAVDSIGQPGQKAQRYAS